jgi:hypothetical protein
MQFLIKFISNLKGSKYMKVQHFLRHAKFLPVGFLIVFAMFISSCSSFKIENVTYGWSAEYIASPDDNGNFTVPKHSMVLNLTKVFQEEKITDPPSKFNIHIIRDDEGYYFITSDKFIFVWVFESREKSLKLYDKLNLLDNKPLNDPKFNEQKPNVKLFMRDAKEFIINKDGVVKKEENK